MLTTTDEQLIADGLSSCDHDYFVWTGLLGEPFLSRGVLSYFDAETVTVVGFPLCGESAASAAWRRRVRAVISDWTQSPAVRFLSYWGPYRIPDTALGGWLPVFIEPPQERNVDVFLDLARPASGRKRRKARQNLHRAGRSGLTLWVGRRPYLGWEHLHLVRELAARDSLGIQDVNCLTNVTSILRSDQTTMFEARVEERLAGFCIAHGYFRTTAFAVLAAFDRRYTGCADLVYSAVLEHYTARGARQVGLGYAYDNGSYRFKTKWPGARVGVPFYELIWERPGTSPTFNGCLHWPWRMLSRQLACGGRCDDDPESPLPTTGQAISSARLS